MPVLWPREEMCDPNNVRVVQTILKQARGIAPWNSKSGRSRLGRSNTPHPRMLSPLWPLIFQSQDFKRTAGCLFFRGGRRLSSTSLAGGDS